MTDLSIVDSFGSAGEAALDTVVGGASIALDTVTRPRRTAGRVRRRGNDVNEVLADVTEDVVDEVTALPERVLVASVRMLRRRARQDDVVGTVSRGVLKALHRPAKDWRRFFERLERETSLDRRRGTSTRGTVRGTARSAARKTATGARRTATTARRTAGRGTTRRSGTTRRGTTARRRTA